MGIQALQPGGAMGDEVSVVIPAYRAAETLPGAIRSLLAQTHAAWQALIVADDAADYEALLAAHGLRDPRLRFLATGGTGTGASATRNTGLDAVSTRLVAVLDADDRMKPDKLARLAAALALHPIASTGLDVQDVAGRTLRLVGAGPDRLLQPRDYKFVNLSMDSMIGWDRAQCDGRYDTGLTNMNDLELLLQLLRTADRVVHIGAPLHIYVKQPASLSNGDGFTARMLAAKHELLRRLATGHYRFPAAETSEGFTRFLTLSLDAEAAYPAALAAAPGLLFEDHLEPILAAALTGTG